MLSNLYNYIVYALAIILSSSGLYLLLGYTPKDSKFKDYIAARRYIAVAFLFWSIQCFILGTSKIRFEYKHYAVAMNITTYFFVALCFYISYFKLISLYNISRFMIVVYFILFSVTTVTVWTGAYLHSINPTLSGVLMLVSGIVLFAFVIALSVRFIIVYRKLKRELDDYSYDNVSTFTRWMYNTIVSVIIIGSAAVPISFFPIEMTSVISIFAILLVMYVFSSFIGYQLDYSAVSSVISEVNDTKEDENNCRDAKNSPYSSFEYFKDDDIENSRLKVDMEMWLDDKRYLSPKIKIDDVVKEFGTNRTYFYMFLYKSYDCTFRSLVNKYRINYAKAYIIENPYCSIEDVSTIVGYQSRTHFTKIFTEQVGMPPKEWKRINSNNSAD